MEGPRSPPPGLEARGVCEDVTGAAECPSPSPAGQIIAMHSARPESLAVREVQAPPRQTGQTSSGSHKAAAPTTATRTKTPPNAAKPPRSGKVRGSGKAGGSGKARGVHKARFTARPKTAKVESSAQLDSTSRMDLQAASSDLLTNHNLAAGCDGAPANPTQEKLWTRARTTEVMRFEKKVQDLKLCTTI